MVTKGVRRMRRRDSEGDGMTMEKEAWALPGGLCVASGMSIDWFL